MWSVLEAAKVRRVAAAVMHCANYVAEYAFCECLVKCDCINLLVLPPPLPPFLLLSWIVRVRFSK